MDIFRICKRKYAKTAFTGIGSDISGGRWNPKGLRAVYTSESQALATMEYFVHATQQHLPPLVCIHATFPESVEFEYFEPADLQKNWRRYPAPPGLQRLGKDWLLRCETIGLMVPSVIIPTEYNIILNPLHPEMNKLKVVDTRKFTFDPRMFNDRT